MLHVYFNGNKAQVRPIILIVFMYYGIQEIRMFFYCFVEKYPVLKIDGNWLRKLLKISLINNNLHPY